MTNNSNHPLAQAQRQDRAVNDEAWVRAMLHRAPFGVLATANNGQPFISINLFVFDETARAIYLHTARTGRTRANIESNERICFSVGEMGRLLPGKTAMEMSIEYGSVVLFGRASVILDPTEATHALQLLVDKYFPHLRPGRDYHPITIEELERTSVYRIQIEEWSGKRKQAADEFPGAFTYGHTPQL